MAIIIEYSGTDAERTAIIKAKEAEGFLLTDVMNIKEGHFLGFTPSSDFDYVKEQGREEIRKIVLEASNLPEMNLEARTHLENKGVLPKSV